MVDPPGDEEVHSVPSAVPARYQLIAALFPLAVLCLGLVQKWRDDGLYSLSAFQQVIFFQSRYFHDPPDGPLQAVASGAELRGHAKALHQQPAFDGWLYNLTSLKSSTRAYLQYRYERHEGPPTDAYVARIEYRLGSEGRLRRMTLRHPPVLIDGAQ